MFKNYLTVAWRNLLRNRASSSINIGGLAVGMTVAMLIGLWIWDEVSFDKSFPNHDNIAQVIQNVTNNGETQTWFPIPYPLGAELRKSYGSDFKYIVTSTGTGTHVLALNDKKLSKSGAYAEPEIGEMLSLNMLKGKRDGLKDPSSVLISESTAKAYFGDADPINKLLKIDNKVDVKVTGVYEDLQYNSSFADLDFIAPWDLFASTYELNKMDNPWRPNSFDLYVQTADNSDMNKISQKIRDVKIHKVHKDEVFHKPQLFLLPMNMWHLNSEFKGGINVGGAIRYVWLFGIIGMFVLLLACINFMNLSTARSEKRAKEVGIRKAIGSLRKQLIWQFFSESLLVVFFAFLLSIILAQFSMPFFNQVAHKRIMILWGNPLFWSAGMGFCLITGLIAGSYPAFYLSSFRPVRVLKGTFRVGRFAAVPRQVLVVLQFTVSVVLIICTIVVFRQIQFARNRPVGYSRDGLVVLPMATEDIHKHFAVVKDELLKTGAIKSIAECSSPTTEINSSNSGFEWKGKDPGLSVDFPNTEVSPEYGKTVAWELVKGRDFSNEFRSDSSAFVINESAAKYMNLKNPVGEIVKWDHNPFTVIGVIKDMVQESPYAPVRPSFYHLSNDAENYITVKINPKMSVSAAIGKIEAVFKIYNPAQPFEYQFADEAYAKKFGDEERVGKLASSFAGLAIFISCLGLFGMASFMAEQRIKEIGVRKVLGASVYNLWRLLSKDFLLLVLISLVIAVPLAYYFMNKWLQNYEYRSGISWWIYGLTAIGRPHHYFTYCQLPGH